MKCDQCAATVSPEDACEHLGKHLCEDCYMDALSPAKTCDPWAAYSAKSFEGKPLDLCDTQKQILDVLKTKGPMTPEALLEKLGSNWTFPSLEREYATLQRLGKIRAVKEGEGILLRIS